MKTKRTDRIPMVISLLAILTLTSVGVAQNYNNRWSKIAGGGGASQSGSYVVRGTVGQWDAANSGSGQFLALGGFWGAALAGQSIVWTNTSGGNWSVPQNWSPNQVPGPLDNVFITIDGTYTVALNVHATNASLTLGGASGTQTLLINSRTLNLTGPSVVNPHGALTETFGTLTNTASLDISGALNWSGGMIGGGLVTVKPGGNLSVTAGTGMTLADCKLINAATFTLGGGPILLTGSATISNAVSGTITMTAFGSGTSGSGIVVNDGQINVAVGAPNLAQLATVFNNNSTVHIQSGMLRLAGGGTTSADGSFSLESGATLSFFTLTHNLMPGSLVTGPGSVTVTGGTVNFNGTFDITGTNNFTSGTANFLGNYTIDGNTVNLSGVANFMPGGTIAPGVLNMSGGTMGASNNVSVSGPMTWTGGTIQGSNTTINPLGGLTLSGGGSKTLTGCALINTATTEWSGSGTLVMFGAAIFSNAPFGTINITTAVNSGAGVIANAGHFIVAPGAGNAATLNSFFTNYGTVRVQSGTLNVPGGALSVYRQAAGLTVLSGGNILNNSPLWIQGGALAGTGAITGSVTNSGVVSPGSSPGRMTIGGTYVQTNGGWLSIEIGGINQGTDYDFLSITNLASLAGALNVSFSDGYLPNAGDKYEIVKFGSRTGTFGSITGLHGATGIVLVPRYSSTNLTLLAAQEPLLSSPTLVGTEFHFDVLTTAGFTYQAEYADSLDAPIQWTPFGGPFIGTGGNVTVIEIPGAVTQRFFRVRIY